MLNNWKCFGHSFFAVLLVAALLAGLLPAFSLPTAASDIELNFTTSVDFEFEEITGSIRRYIGSETEVVIPETINGVKVEAISDGAFAGCSSLIHITIPDGVTYIDGGAFEGCFSLTGIQVAETNQNYCSVNGVLFSKDQTTICRYPAGCSEKSYAIPDGVKQIGRDAFESCSSLTGITIPDSVWEIGDSAFAGCSSLIHITMPGGMRRIGGGAFWGCSSLISIAISDGVTYIADTAFVGCSSLTGIQVAETNQSYCSVNGVLFSKDQTKICRYPAGCSEKSYAIPDGVKQIGWYAFESCSSLTGITIPGGVTEIGEYAFEGCSSLTGITISGGVERIGGGAFAGCSSLMEIQVAETNQRYYSFCGVLFSKFQTTIYDGGVYIPKDVITICCYPAGRSEKKYAISAGVTKIDICAFEGCSLLTDITIPDSVEEISQRAFKGCSSLTSITIPDNLTAISNKLFEDCSSLTSITIPASVREICSDAFAGCSSLTGITIPDKVKEIYERAFYGCSSLTDITIPSSVIYIYDSAFEGCSSLTDITISPYLRSIGHRVFYGCSSLAKINILGWRFDLSLLAEGGDQDFIIRYPGTEEDWVGEWGDIEESNKVRRYLTERVSFGSSVASFVWGDVDGNGKVESKDKVLVARYLAKWAMDGGFKKAAADFNKDGDVTSAEAVVLARYLAKWSNLPYPVGQKVS